MKTSIQISLVLLFLNIVMTKTGWCQTKEFDINGLKVIYKSVPKQIISTRLFIEGGTANYNIGQSGIEDFALKLVISAGTNEMSKLDFSTASEKMGTTITAGSDYDYGQISMRCVKQNWDASWALFADAILHPAFDEQQFKLLREQLISAARQKDADPDHRIKQAAIAGAFEGENYQKIPQGTPTTLAQLSLQDLKKYYRAVLAKKRVFLVVVGDLDLEDLKEKIKTTLSKIPKGQRPPKEERNLISRAGHQIIDSELATNYILGVMSAPLARTSDGIAMMIAMSILSERYYLELRTKRGLSYAQYAYYDQHKISHPISLLQISTTSPGPAIQVMVDEICLLKQKGFDPEELTNKKQKYLTQYFMRQETLSSQSQSLGLSEMQGGWELAESFTERVNAVTLEDINHAIDQYTDVIHWTYLGKKGKVNKEDFLQPTKNPRTVNINPDSKN